MKTNFLSTKFIYIILLLSVSIVYSQTDIIKETKLNMNGNWGIKNSENVQMQKNLDNKIPQTLLEQYRRAKLTHNQKEKIRTGSEMEKYMESTNRPKEGTYEKTVVFTEPPAPFSPDWYNNDVQVYSGDIAYTGGFRQMDLKTGEDGWLYLAVNRRNVSGFNGYINVYRSSNGGINWSFIFGAANGSAYFGSLTMLVEKRHASINDSTRIMVIYTRSSNSNLNDAGLEVVSARRDGSAPFADMFASPSSGNKYEFPSACSDGMYWDVATYMHVIARECTNSGTQVGLRHWLSMTWCTSWTNILINTFNPDYYPSAAYCEKGTGNDSIYIAVERRINSTEYEIRAIITCEWLTPNFFAYYITSAPSGTKYERPCITVQQQHANVPRRILITYTRNNLARYCFSVNGGQSWSVDAALGTNGLADFTWCNSDSLTGGDGYAVACFVDQNGDSVTVRRGNMTGSLGTYHYKRNSVMSTGALAPVCSIYKIGSNKYAAFAYAGQGPSNLYFNQENLQTGIHPVTRNMPGDYMLSQNYPNPFNPSTRIDFSIPNKEYVILRIYDILGNATATLVKEELTMGTYSISYDASGLAAGVYFYRIDAGSFSDVKKMILIK